MQISFAKLVGNGGESMDIPVFERTLLAEIARKMEAEKSVSVVAEHYELTTQRAGNILGVSHPFLVGMLEDGKLAHQSLARIVASTCQTCSNTKPSVTAPAMQPSSA